MLRGVGLGRSAADLLAQSRATLGPKRAVRNSVDIRCCDLERADQEPQRRWGRVGEEFDGALGPAADRKAEQRRAQRCEEDRVQDILIRMSPLLRRGGFEPLPHLLEHGLERRTPNRVELRSTAVGCSSSGDLPQLEPGTDAIPPSSFGHGVAVPARRKALPVPRESLASLGLNASADTQN